MAENLAQEKMDDLYLKRHIVILHDCTVSDDWKKNCICMKITHIL